MTQQLLRLIDDAVSELYEAHKRFAAQKRVPQAEQSLRLIAPAIRSAYIAVEKMLKHALASIDPYLIYDELRPDAVRSLIKDMRASGSPSALASRHSLRTLTLADSWAAVQELGLLPTDSVMLSQFGSTVKQLIAVRRQVQHAELWGAPSELLSLLEQLFAQIRKVGIALVPDLDLRLLSLDSTLPIAFKAIEEKVDQGWIHLRELVTSGRSPEFEMKMITTIRSPEGDPELALVADDGAVSYLIAFVLVPRANAAGFFLTHLSQDQLTARFQLMEADLPIHQIPDQDIPPAPPKPLLGLLIAPKDEASQFIEESLRKNAERKRLALERYGLIPLEDGLVRIPRAAAWGHWTETEKKMTMLSELLLQNVEIAYTRNERTGHVKGVVGPNPSLEGSASAGSLNLRGSCWLTGEYVADERTKSEMAPPGTVIRFHRVRITMSSTD